MALRFKNSFSRQKEEFKPIDAGKVRMYTCGPTVYGFAHIGNFRAYMFEDLLRRYLKYKGYAVTQVMNLTDVDDKTIRDSQAAGISSLLSVAKLMHGLSIPRRRQFIVSPTAR